MNSAAELNGDMVLEARRLLGMWENLSRQHISMGAACACGIGGITVQLQDFEKDIVDYLVGKAEREGRSDVLSFLESQASQAPNGEWSISALLVALADADVNPPAEVSRMLLGNLGRTLSSFAKLHG